MCCMTCSYVQKVVLYQAMDKIQFEPQSDDDEDDDGDDDGN